MNLLKTCKFILILSACQVSGLAQSRSWEPASNKEVAGAYQKAGAWFINTPSYAFKLRYASFKDAATSTQVESSEGYYKRVSGSYVTEAMGIKTIQNLKIKLIVDTVDKMITVMDLGTLSPGIATMEEMESLLSNTKSLKKSKQSKGIWYRIDFKKNSQFDAYEFLVNENGRLERLTYYYSEQVEKKDGDWRPGATEEVKIRPRLEISLFSYEVPAKYNESEFSEQTVLTGQKEKISLTGMYSDFRLLDYRIRTQKQK